METTQNQDQQPTQEKNHSIASRALVATAFGYVGAKIGTVGSLIDANELLKEEKTVGQKIGSVFNGKLWSELKKQTVNIMETENKNILQASAKTMKYGIIGTVVGVGAGGVIGWIRGGRIDNWKDIVKHPWQSTKIIFGAEKPNSETAQNVASAQAITTKPENSTKWQDYTKERTQNTATIGRTS